MWDQSVSFSCQDPPKLTKEMNNRESVQNQSYVNVEMSAQNETVRWIIMRVFTAARMLDSLVHVSRRVE